MQRSTIAIAILSAGALGLAALAGTAVASEDERPGATASGPNWMSVSALATKLESEGYRVREIEIDDGRYEVDVTDATGAQLWGYVDPVSGEVIRGWRED